MRGSALKLDSIARLEKLRALSTDALKELWALRNDSIAASATTIASSIPGNLATAIQSRFKQYPRFILPIPRLGGQEIIYFEGAFPAIDHVPSNSLESSCFSNFSLFGTALEDFKRHGASLLQPSISLHFFLELATKEPHLALISGSYQSDLFNRLQCLRLLNSFCSAYGRDDYFGRWVKPFHEAPDAFDFEAFVTEFCQQ